MRGFKLDFFINSFLLGFFLLEVALIVLSFDVLILVGFRLIDVGIFMSIESFMFGVLGIGVDIANLEFLWLWLFGRSILVLSQMR